MMNRDHVTKFCSFVFVRRLDFSPTWQHFTRYDLFLLRRAPLKWCSLYFGLFDID